MNNFSLEIIKNTLVDYPRLNKLLELVNERHCLHGDMAEVGVYKGGTAYLISSNTNTPVHLFDTFTGLPTVGDKDTHHTGDFSGTSLEYVTDLLRDFSNVRINHGKFPDTVTAEHESASYSLVHVDVDIYQSVKDCLEFFSPRMMQGGIIVLDDYNAPTCPGAKLATDEFCLASNYKLEPTVQCQAVIRF